jgi:hypothetical protein
MTTKETEMIRLSQVHKETGIPLRTLQHAARMKKLRAVWNETPIGGYYETTREAVESWRKLYYKPANVSGL